MCSTPTRLPLEDMTDVDRLFREYIAEHQAGGDADPLAYLAQLAGADRRELEALIDGYLTHAPRQPAAPTTYEGSLAERIVESLAPSVTGVSGLWPAVLPDLRNRARIKRADLVVRLASALGVSDHEAKVADYYHQMETGLLPAEGVSTRVLEALGSILGQSAERLRAMGGALAAGEAPGGEAPAFARVSRVDDATLTPGQAAPPDDWDEVDKLFRGTD